MENKDLSDYRKDIDSIDDQIIQLLDKRFNVVKKIGDYKKINNIPVLNSSREDEILENILKITGDRANRSSISKIYKEIFNQSREAEK